MGKITRFPNSPNVRFDRASHRSSQQNTSQPWKRKLLSWVLMLAVGYFAFLFVDQGIKYYQLLQQREYILQEIEDVKQDKQVLEEDLERLQDPDYLELLARRKFGLVKDGDILLEVPSN